MFTVVVCVGAEHKDKNKSQREDVHGSVNAEPAVGQALTVEGSEEFWRQKWQCAANACDGFRY